MLLKYEQMGMWKVDDCFWRVVGPLGLEDSTELRRGNTYEQVKSGRG
jgi:hypothetical protein